MSYNENFIKCVDDAINRNSPNGEFYIGTGNPNSKILIIGKELGFKDDVEQKKREITDNIPNWKKNISENITIEKLTTEYNPLFPYYKWEIKLGEGHTWSKYQKLMNYLTENNECFHEKSFLTELNHVPAKISKPKPILSEERLRFIKNSTFFQNFKIIILACGKYLNEGKIQEIFEVKKKEPNKSEPRKRLVIYKSEKKILINTNQLSMAISNEYLKKISEEIIESGMLKNKKISTKTIKKIYETARIEEVIGEFVTLKQSGNLLVGHCPFHEDNAHSFHVSVSEGNFECVSCGKSGDAVSFLMPFKKYKYPGALRFLAQKYNIQIEEVDAPILSEKEKMDWINQTGKFSPPKHLLS